MTGTDGTDVVLEVQGLTKSYGSLIAVNGISFGVRKKEIFGILGPNGAWKTTTLECIETLRPFDAGNIVVGGIDVRRNPDAVKRIIGVQLQSSSFFDKLRLGELLDLFAALYGRKVDPIALLRDVELHERVKSVVSELSGGQKQRFSIAAALVNTPMVLFLDEPTTGLDPQARRHLWGIIKRIRDEGTTVVLTTHYMDEAEELCDRVAIMDQGNIATMENPHVLIDRLIQSGFATKRVQRLATLEDVFLTLTGHSLRED